MYVVGHILDTRLDNLVHDKAAGQLCSSAHHPHHYSKVSSLCFDCTLQFLELSAPEGEGQLTWEPCHTLPGGGQQCWTTHCLLHRRQAHTICKLLLLH